MGSLLSRVTSTAQALPSRVFLYAREKWGKSSLFAHAPGAIFFMTRGETGLTELIAGGRVPPTAHFEYDEQNPPTWSTLRQAVKELAEEDHPHKALVIDTCNGAEILCQEYVRRAQFNNSQAKFASYGKGWDACRVEWLALLQDLDALRSRRKMSVVLLAHTRVKKFDDPTQEEGYDKYQPACQDKLWDLTHKWADIICFGHFRADTYETDSGKVKARAEVRRVLCFDQSPMWEAGNRYGIAGELNVGGGAKAGFAAFAQAVAKAKAASQQQAAKPASPPPPAAPGQQQPEPGDDTFPLDNPEGDDGPDPTPASASATSAAPSAATTPAATAPTKSPSSPAPDAQPRPMPAAGDDLCKRIVELLGGKTGLDWTQVRDDRLDADLRPSESGGIARHCGFTPAPMLKVRELTPGAALKLYELLKARANERAARAAKRAAGRAGAA